MKQASDTDLTVDRRVSTPRVIAILNQKGGVGKTTTTVNLGDALARRGLRVVVVDLDPQGHLSACLGEHDTDGKGIDRVLLHAEPADQQLIDSRSSLALIPAGDELAAFEYRRSGIEHAGVLRDALRELVQPTDIVLLDCAPSSGMLAVNAVSAADDVLMPIAGDYLSLTGLARLMLTLRRLRRLRSAAMRKWIFLSRFTPRRRLSQEVYAKVKQHFSSNLLCTAVQEAAALAECAGAGKTIFEYRGKSRSAREFTALADDLLNARVVGDEQEKTSDVA